MAFLSGQSAADQIKYGLRRRGTIFKENWLFVSPIVLATFRKNAEVLQKVKVAIPQPNNSRNFVTKAEPISVIRFIMDVLERDKAILFMLISRSDT